MHTSSTPALLIAASTLIRLAHPTDASLHRALDKAQDRLMTTPWRMAFELLDIVSASHPNEIHIATRTGCTCEARRTCWHMAALLIVATISATGVELVPALPLPNMVLMEDYADFDAYAGDFLDEAIIWSISE